MKNKKEASKITKVLQNAIFFCFIIIFSVILFILLCFSWIKYCGENDFIFLNIVSLLIGLVAVALIYFVTRKINISKRAFRRIVIAFFIIAYLIQLAILYFAYFDTAWDAGYVNSLANSVVRTGSIPISDGYLQRYPNNTFIVAVFAVIKSVSIISDKYFFLLAINALLVNLACLFTCLSIKKLKSSRAAILSLFILAPLVLFSPWIIIPYSDTFSVLLPILAFYIYIACNKPFKYCLIIFICLIGYFIKPTVAIMLIAILAVELISHKISLSPKAIFTAKHFKQAAAIAASIGLAFLMKFAANYYINFQKSPALPATFTHFLAMGQNDKTCGRWDATDVKEIANGQKAELSKFKNRLLSRNPCEQANFFAKKLLTNYNSGVFAWSSEGNFYVNIPKRDDAISKMLASYFYSSGKNYRLFNQFNQIIWITVLFGCIFIRRSNSKSQLVICLSLIGIFLFVMLFEARARYLFSYAPIFVVCATIGFSELKEKLKKGPLVRAVGFEPTTKRL